MLVDIPDHTLQSLAEGWKRFEQLKKVEETTGKAPYEIFDYEDQYGCYDWLIEHIVNQYENRSRDDSGG